MNQAASGVEEGESCGSVTANAHGYVQERARVSDFGRNVSMA